MRTSFFLSRPAALALFGILALTALSGSATAASAAKAPKDDFMPFVQLAPFRVNGQQMTVSVFARSKRDRRYAEDFAEEVVKVVAEGVTPETGKGLVIIGKKGEPHPIFVFRKFLALARDGKLDAEVAARAPELDAMLHHWETTVGDGKVAKADGDEGVDLEFEKIVTALPLPLEGLGAKLYQLAWTEGFDDAKVEARLRALQAADLQANLFARFDWVFYLPPRGALENAIDDLIADALKQEDVGFFARMAVKGVMVVVKPKIKKAVEGMRRGVMFSAIVTTRTPYDAAQVSDLTGSYVEVLMPDAKDGPGTEHEQAVRAVQNRVRLLETEKQADAELRAKEIETENPGARVEETPAAAEEAPEN